MKRFIRVSAVLLIVLAVVAGSQRCLFGQAADDPFGANSFTYGKAEASTFQNSATKKVLAARDKLAKAKSDEDKVAAEKELRETLGEYFVEDMKGREKQLGDVQQRVVDLQSHLKKRLAAKTDIIELQLKSFVYEADGLGLFGTAPTTTRYTSTFYTGSSTPYGYSAGKRVVSVPNVFEGKDRPFGPTLARASGKTAGALGRINELRKKLKAGSSEKEKAGVQDELKKAMSDYFDEDMKRREKELEEIKKRLTDMESHLKKRTASMDAIIDLQVKMFVNDAEGLGFFGRSKESGAGVQWPVPHAVR